MTLFSYNIFMRRKRNHKRDIPGDTRYNNKEMAKFINNLMLAGNKGTVEKFFYEAMNKVSELTNVKDIPLLFGKIISNVTLAYELRSRRVGGATYQVPKLLEDYRSLSKTIKLLVKTIRNVEGKALNVAIADVFMDAYNKTGGIYVAYTSLTNAVESNKVNTVYRW